MSRNYSIRAYDKLGQEMGLRTTNEIPLKIVKKEARKYLHGNIHKIQIINENNGKVLYEERKKEES